MPDTSPIVERVRHTLKFRIATVEHVARITPRMVRVTLRSEDFADFVSAAYDDHVKLFFPEPGSALPTPKRGDNGLVFPDGKRPPARDYTPRAFDPGARTLTIDFVLHGDGPAASWAATASPGDTIGVGGPRGSFVVRARFDWYLLVGDETALPAIGRRIEELPGDASVRAIVEVATAAEQQALDGPADTAIDWIARDGAAPGDPGRLLEAVRNAKLPQGAGYVFVAGEQEMRRAVRAHLVEERGHNPDWIKAAGYWQAGTTDFDDGHAH